MTSFIDIKPGQWVLAFHFSYGPMNGDLTGHLARFCSRGGGWESHSQTEIFHVARVFEAKAKTYRIDQSDAVGPYHIGLTHSRSNVIAAADKRETMETLRDQLYAIGETADDRIEAEMYRRIQAFATREHSKALKKIHKLLPQHFGRTA